MNRRSFLMRLCLGLGGACVSSAAAFSAAISWAWDPDHTPKHFQDRLDWNIRERIWLRMWQKENNPPSYLNSGIGPLEGILKREPTKEEKAAVAGVLQWFGSNCGSSFIEETLGVLGSRVLVDDGAENSVKIRELSYGLGPQPKLPARIPLKQRGRTIYV